MGVAYLCDRYVEKIECRSIAGMQDAFPIACSLMATNNTVLIAYQSVTNKIQICKQEYKGIATLA